MIAIDANVLIYAIENPLDPIGVAAQRVVAGPSIVGSTLLRVEVARGNHPHLNPATHALYEATLANGNIDLIPVDLVLKEAERIAGAYGFKAADAVHLATAVVGGATGFATNDLALRRFPELPILPATAWVTSVH